MTQLSHLQQDFVDAIFSKSGEDDHAILQHVVADSGLEASQRIGIYRSAILGSFNRVIEETYPVIRQLLGEEFFHAMAVLFARKYASIQPDFGEYGEEMAEFLQDFAPVKDLPYLPDVARLEYIWNKVFYADDDPPADFSVLARLDEEALQSVRFRLSASAELFYSPYPVLDIWQANQPVDQSHEDQTEIDLNAGEDHLLVVRQNLELRVDRLSPIDWSLLKAIQNRRDFQSLVEIAGGVDEINQRLPFHVERGWIAGLDF